MEIDALGLITIYLSGTVSLYYWMTAKEGYRDISELEAFLGVVIFIYWFFVSIKMLALVVEIFTAGTNTLGY